MKDLMKKAHQMTREIKREYPEVNYKFQLGLCMSYLLSEKEGGNKMEDERIIQLKELAAEDKNYNKVWNKVERLSKEIRGRKFSNEEIEGFKYKAENIINLAVEILKEEIKKEEVKKETTVKELKNKNYITAKYDGYDAETGERFYAGDLITFVKNVGWVRADNY